MNEDDFYRALAANDMKTIKKYEIDKIDISQPNIHGYTALHFCVCVDAKNTMLYLLEKGANPNQRFTQISSSTGRKTYDEGTVLMGVQTLEIAKELVKHGAKISLKDANGHDAIFHAKQRKKDDIAQFLVMHLQENPEELDEYVPEDEAVRLQKQQEKMKQHHNEKMQKLLSEKPNEELKTWLYDGVSTLGIYQTNKKSIAFADSLYKAGAKAIHALDIEDDGAMLNSGKLIIKLPANTEYRKELFKLANNVITEQGFSEEVDIGQECLFLMLD